MCDVTYIFILLSCIIINTEIELDVVMFNLKSSTRACAHQLVHVHINLRMCALMIGGRVAAITDGVKELCC